MKGIGSYRTDDLSLQGRKSINEGLISKGCFTVRS